MDRRELLQTLGLAGVGLALSRHPVTPADDVGDYNGMRSGWIDLATQASEEALPSGLWKVRHVTIGCSGVVADGPVKVMLEGDNHALASYWSTDTAWKESYGQRPAWFHLLNPSALTFSVGCPGVNVSAGHAWFRFDYA